MVESQALYNLLENDVIPCFYERENGNIPGRWLKKMKSSMKMAMLNFCSHHMVDKYENLFYRTAAERMDELAAHEAQEAQRLNALMGRLYTHWGNIQVNRPVRDNEGPFRVGESFHVSAEVFLGDLRPDEVEVEIYYGNLKNVDSLESGRLNSMSVETNLRNGHYKYGCHLSCDVAGRYGFTARVTPRGDGMIKHSPGFITWA
jgi:starch phosphorylase